MTIDAMGNVTGTNTVTPLVTPQIDRTVGSNATAAANAQTATPQQPGSPQSLQQAVNVINSVVQQMASNLQFSVDQSTGRTVVKVVDTNNNQIIRQIPSPEVLSIAHAIDRLQGILYRGKA